MGALLQRIPQYGEQVSLGSTLDTCARTVEVRRLASAYSPAVLRALGSDAHGETVGPRLAPVVSLVDGRAGASLADAFVAGEAVLRARYRIEYIYKNDLVSRIVFGRHAPTTASVVPELSMGRACADLVILNGTSTIYEIKTDLDQFDRLASQLQAYVSRAEYVNVVIGEKRASRTVPDLPANVGVIIARRSGRMSTARAASSNADRLNVDHLYQLLRVDEALRVLKGVSGYDLDVPRGHAWKRMRELFSELDVDLVHSEVVKVLKARGRTAAAMAIDPRYPRSLRALAYTIPLSAASSQRILGRLDTPAAMYCL